EAKDRDLGARVVGSGAVEGCGGCGRCGRCEGCQCGAGLEPSSEGMTQLLKDFLDRLRLNRNASRHTVTAYENDLSQFFQFVAASQSKKLDAVTPADIDVSAIRGFLAELHRHRISASSSARKLSALRTFIKYLKREDLVDDDASALVPAPKRGETIPAHLTVDEMSRLLEMPDESSLLGRRDRAILALFYASG